MSTLPQCVYSHKIGLEIAKYFNVASYYNSKALEDESIG